MADAADFETFRAELERTGHAYRLLDHGAGDCAKVQFTGRFQGRDVIWNATVTTLAGYNRQHDRKRKAIAHRQFIDIPPGDGTMRDIVIGLSLGTIDHATLLKTITMIRKYKRLHIGRHEFGDSGN